MLKQILFLVVVTLLILPAQAEKLYFGEYQEDQQNYTQADVLAACLEDRRRDLTCEKILELNDFARDFIDVLVRQYNLKNYEREIGTVAGVMLYRKVTLRIYRDLDLTYNLDNDVLSVNYGRGF